MSDVVSEEVHWVWEPYIAHGMVTLVEGDPGVGKSFFTLYLAAALSRGSDLPGGVRVDQSNVLLLSAEDGIAHTIRARLDRLMAVNERVFALERVVVLDDDGLNLIEEEIKRRRPAMLIIDPLTAFIGGSVDMNAANKVRPFMQGLADLAREWNLAVIVVRHFRKQAGNAISRGGGSIDFAAAVRSIIQIGAHPSDPNLRVMAHAKSNIGLLGPSLAFALADGNFEWRGECDVTADQLSLSSVVAPSPRRAVQFVSEHLSAGPLAARELNERAAAVGLSKRTVDRARKELGVTSTRVGEPGKQGGGQWLVGLDYD